MTRTLMISGVAAEFTVLSPGDMDPSKRGGWVQMAQAGEIRTIYLDPGRLPLDQVDLDTWDPELLEAWWHEAGQR